MINTFFGANLVDYFTIRIAIFSEVTKNASSPFNLIIDGEKIVVLEIAKQNEAEFKQIAIQTIQEQGYSYDVKINMHVVDI